LDGKIDGTVVEAYDGVTPIGGVLVEVRDDTPTNELTRTYTHTDGTYRAYDDLTVNVDTRYSKASYVTQDNEAGALDQAAVNISLVDGIKVTVKDAGANPVTDAKVDIYTCTAGGNGSNPSACTTWALNTTCTQPVDNCTRTGEGATAVAGDGLIGEYYFAGMTTGTYIQVRVSDPSLVFDTVYSPDSSETSNSFVTSASAAINPIFAVVNPSAGKLAGDATAPTVEAMLPLDNATGVPVDVQPLLTFSELMNLNTLNNANIKLYRHTDDIEIPLQIILLGQGDNKTKVMLDPTNNLAYNTKYYITVNGNVTDVNTNALVATWTVGNKATHEFTTAALQTGDLGVLGITQTKSWGTADNTYGNGWEWVIRATVPTDELRVALKFNNWTGTGAATIAAANNIRYFCPQSAANQDAATAVTIATAATYPANMTIVAANDLEADQPGIQVEITVQAKIPIGSTAGAYSTSYGLRSQ